MISEKLQAEFNQRINDEFYAWYLYTAMAAYFEHDNFRGFAHWMRKQAEEEMGHATKNLSYLLERGGKVSLKPIAQVPDSWATPLAAFEAAYQHEQKVTGIYGKFFELAQAEKDHAAEIFLQWYVNEQVEEEAQTAQAVDILKKIKDSVGGLYQLDHQLGKR
ncbi:MAG: ferritin [Candidatus Firestonebacteria bacterium]|nr:ferritin [Candidatus Firestonebacteria bacterium]